MEAPALFPPTFLYTQSWEDPRADEPILQINERDVCLTLTSGGCNSLHLCINGAKAVSGTGGYSGAGPAVRYQELHSGRGFCCGLEHPPNTNRDAAPLCVSL